MRTRFEHRMEKLRVQTFRRVRKSISQGHKALTSHRVHFHLSPITRRVFFPLVLLRDEEPSVGVVAARVGE